MGFLDFLTGGKNTAGDSLIKQGEGYLGQQGQIGSQYGQMAQNAAGDYGQDNAAYRGAMNQEGDLLSRGIGTQYINSLANRNSGNIASGYLGGAANLTSSLESRGLGSSGLMAGGLANLDAARAGQTSSALNQAQLQGDELSRQHAAQLTGLYGGAAGQDYGRQMGAMGAQNGIYGNLAQQYQNLGNQAYQRRAAQQQGLFQTLGGLAQTGMQIYGMSKNPLMSLLSGGGGGQQTPFANGQAPLPAANQYWSGVGLRDPGMSAGMDAGGFGGGGGDGYGAVQDYGGYQAQMAPGAQYDISGGGFDPSMLK